MQAQKITNNAS